MTTPHTKDLGIAIRDALDGVLFRFWVRAVEKRRKVRKP
jgi:hypothetical protein